MSILKFNDPFLSSGSQRVQRSKFVAFDRLWEEIFFEYIVKEHILYGE